MGPCTISIPENSRPDFTISESNPQDKKVRNFGHENAEEQKCGDVEYDREDRNVVFQQFILWHAARIINKTFKILYTSPSTVKKSGVPVAHLIYRLG